MITHVSFSGGGIKGFCYLGVLRYLYIEKLIDHIKYVSGSSIGAYFTLILALKMPMEVIESDFTELLKEINDSNVLSIDKNSFIKLFDKNGFHSCRFLMRPVIKYFKDKYGVEDLTFIDFVKKTGVNIYINTTNVNTTHRKVFSAESTPDISVIDAVVASMTVPILFEAVQIDGEYYVDGVISQDMPIDIFENVNKNNVLGILMYESKNDQLQAYPKMSELNFINYTCRIASIMIMNLINQSVYKYKNKDYFWLLKITDLPYERSFKFCITDEGNIKVDLNQTDVDNLILKGFIDTTNYMNKRYSKKDE